MLLAFVFGEAFILLQVTSVLSRYSEFQTLKKTPEHKVKETTVLTVAAFHFESLAKYAE